MFALEKRGYVKAGPWTPEAVIEHPEAGLLSSFPLSLNNAIKSEITIRKFLAPSSSCAVAPRIPACGRRCAAGAHVLRVGGQASEPWQLRGPEVLGEPSF